MSDTIIQLETALKELKQAKHSRDLLAQLLRLWPRHGHERFHYGAVAKHQETFHHIRMLELLEEAERFMKDTK